jgi:hypothetical protein
MMNTTQIIPRHIPLDIPASLVACMSPILQTGNKYLPKLVVKMRLNNPEQDILPIVLTDNKKPQYYNNIT